MPTDIAPGLLVLHGNRAELLGDAVFAWLRRQPLAPLEQEVFLVQSNGVAEWLKMDQATQGGIFAAARVELPGRFLWRAYRQVLGPGAVPADSALDKLPLTWRLMQQLPELLEAPGFEPLAGFLARGGLERRLQLAQRLADLFDQYQVYRSDWLDAWGQGFDTLPRQPDEAPAAAPPLPPDQCWQAALWRALLAPLDPLQRAATRPQLHRRFLAALASGAAPASALPRRVVMFGMTHVPLPTLQALAALAGHCQVLLAVPNPCRYHWADILPGRELLRAERRRHPLRKNRDLAALSLEDMHAHAHPLLAAWGRQGRDFVRQLDAFDDAQLASQRFALAKIDLFDDGPGDSLLQQVQAHIRDLVPMTEHAGVADPADRSIVFHIAHSAQREVEILHDQLLALLAAPTSAPGAAPLQPRDVVVMVPDIASFAPAIRSVFGQMARADARYIPFDIADLQARANNPLLQAMEWLLRLPQQRCGQSELRDLLDVPAVLARFGLRVDELPRLAAWIDGAGIRWGLDIGQRNSLGLGACGEANTWLFGIHRMLLGYAVGEGADLAGIEPYAEIGGLDAALAGALAAMVQALLDWAALAATPATPSEWGQRCRKLITQWMAASDDRERASLSALHEALRAWLAACELARFDAPVSLAVLREAWLSGLDAPSLNRRFRAGGVTFCTLMPMRAVPFEVVCLLGMNDGDYPRRSPRSDFDLMGLPDQARPGDRSRRDDDRQLMLEALLSARQVLYLSWTGRSVRDNSEQSPSVLVSQLRDYLVAGWGAPVLAHNTSEHPLQPFSRRYFEQSRAAPALFTHAREWRAAHVAPAKPSAAVARVAATPAGADLSLTLDALTRFLKNPVRDYFRRQLDVVFGDGEAVADDDEAFGLAGLEVHGLLQALIDPGLAALQAAETAGEVAGNHEAGHRVQGPALAAPDLRAVITAQVARFQRAGQLPMAEQGRRAAQDLVHIGVGLFDAWGELQALYPLPAPRQPLRFAAAGLQLDDWLTPLRCAPGAPAAPVWLQLSPSRLCSDPAKRTLRRELLIPVWIGLLAAAACGVPVRAVLVGRDASVTLDAPPQADAAALLQTLMQAWRDGMASPLPLAARTALALLAGGDAVGVYEGRSFPRGAAPAEGDEPCLARAYPDFESLVADGRFVAAAEALFGPMLRWIDDHATVRLHAEPGTTSDEANAAEVAHG